MRLLKRVPTATKSDQQRPTDRNPTDTKQPSHSDRAITTNSDRPTATVPQRPSHKAADPQQPTTTDERTATQPARSNRPTTAKSDHPHATDPQQPANSGRAAADYVQEHTGRYDRSFSHGMIFNSDRIFLNLTFAVYYNSQKRVRLLWTSTKLSSGTLNLTSKTSEYRWRSATSQTKPLPPYSV